MFPFDNIVNFIQIVFLTCNLCSFYGATLLVSYLSKCAMVGQFIILHCFRSLFLCNQCLNIWKTALQFFFSRSISETFQVKKTKTKNKKTKQCLWKLAEIRANQTYFSKLTGKLCATKCLGVLCVPGDIISPFDRWDQSTRLGPETPKPIILSSAEKKPLLRAGSL